jgi:ribosomal protein S12 methylthiotransferase accessory factor
VPAIIPGLNSATECLQNLELELAVANDLLTRYGVTRLANLTGLDAIDVPVWSCARPRSRSLAVSFGKGLTDSQAQASAIMESMESSFAEDRDAIVSLSASVDELEAAGVETVPLRRLSRCRFEDVDRSARLGWVRGVSLNTASTVFAPFELVGLDYTNAGGSPAAYRMSSIGLGAGKTWEGAVGHALLELIEHDAVAILELMPALAEALPAESYRPGFSDRLDEAVELFEAGGIDPIFRAVSSQLGFPVVMCSIPRFPSAGTERGKICAGFASRQSVEEAALAALLEAAQVRMTMIAGAREDLQWSDYQQVRHLDPRAPASTPPGGTSTLFVASPDEPRTNLGLQETLQRLGRAGIHNVYAFALNRPGDPIHVVRVLAEGLDVADPESGMNLGQRAISILLNLATATS